MKVWRESKRAACPQDLWLELIHQYQPFLDIGGRLVNGAESSFIYTSSWAQVNKSRSKKNIMRPPTSQLVAALVCLVTLYCKRCKSSDFKFPSIFWIEKNWRELLKNFMVYRGEDIAARISKAVRCFIYNSITLALDRSLSIALGFFRQLSSSHRFQIQSSVYRTVKLSNSSKQSDFQHIIY
ncbi:uncharacterized protein LOC102655928 isoform X1 [Apis mellifera]|uniref:Uncharacterized protein LOC102655928 isoform X1 n=1 Tax=Apis mellifera TaxID=7460 RepID=A0A7M7GW00_APIME|nr:uncharacterized protein LOC102655928 isoform X1 [Apis mellifera]|eukprot:XP_006561457.2 uncharacterized protein LOC102655928 isoform X1 [Apis mellifera]